GSLPPLSRMAPAQVEALEAAYLDALADQAQRLRVPGGDPLQHLVKEVVERFLHDVKEYCPPYRKEKLPVTLEALWSPQGHPGLFADLAAECEELLRFWREARG